MNKAEFAALDSWWDHKLKMELAGQKHRISSALLHELNEAKIALSMEDPNVGMALDRINRAINSISNH